MRKPDKTMDRYWDMPLQDLMRLLEATPAGLTSAEAKQRLRLHGPNSLAGESRFAGLINFLGFFANPLVLILLAASAISIALGDPVGGSIIIAIVLLSVIVNFYTEFQARRAVEDIRKQVATTAAVLRDGQELELPTAGLVRGDVIRLNAGDLAPADARLLDSKDLHVRESALTGESLPVDSTALPTPATAFSWGLPCRRESERRSSFARAETPPSAKSPNGWPRGRRKPNSAAAYATSGS